MPRPWDFFIGFHIHIFLKNQFSEVVVMILGKNDEFPLLRVAYFYIDYIYFRRPIYYPRTTLLALPPTSTVTQIRGHIAGPSPPSPPHGVHVPSFLFATREEFIQHFLPSSTRVANCACVLDYNISMLYNKRLFWFLTRSVSGVWEGCCSYVELCLLEK